MKSTDIKAWWFRNTVIPVIGFALTLIAVLGYLFVSQHIAEGKSKDQLINQTLSSLSLSISKKDRVFTENLLLTLASSGKFGAVAVCNGPNSEIQYPATRKTICENGATSRNFINGQQELELAIKDQHDDTHIFLSLLAIILIAMIFLVYIQFIRKKFMHEIVEPLASNPLMKLDCHIREIAVLRRNYAGMVTDLAQLRTSREVFNNNRKVAHDIRSPLTALKIVSQLKDKIPLEISELISGVVTRVESVAEGLLREGRQLPKSNFDFTKELRLLICEKQYNLSPIQVTLSTHNEDLIKCAFLNEELLCTISNLIDNSAQSGLGCTEIEVLIEQSVNNITVAVEDNGPGIPEVVLKKYKQGPISFGKSNGNGLGLYYARKFAEGHGGQLHLNLHRRDSGSQVLLVFPKKLN